jgi:hypothetical protein
MCLYIDGFAQLPRGLDNLTSLEELHGLQMGAGYFNWHVAKELGHLTKMRMLDFGWGKLGESQQEALVDSLGNMGKLESLTFYAHGGCVDLMREGWVPPIHLRRFCCRGPTSSFQTLPAFINPSSLPLLSFLEISVVQVRSDDIQLLGMMPALRSLSLSLDTKFTGEQMEEMYMLPLMRSHVRQNATSITFSFCRLYFNKGLPQGLNTLGSASGLGGLPATTLIWAWGTSLPSRPLRLTFSARKTVMTT